MAKVQSIKYDSKIQIATPLTPPRLSWTSRSKESRKPLGFSWYSRSTDPTMAKALSSIVACQVSATEQAKVELHQFLYYFLTTTNSVQQLLAIGSVIAMILLVFAMLGLQTIPRAAHLLAGTKLKLGLILILLGFTCVAVGMATNTATGVAINASGGISFENLYYFAWVSSACSTALLMPFLRTDYRLVISSKLELWGD